MKKYISKLAKECALYITTNNLNEVSLLELSRHLSPLRLIPVEFQPIDIIPEHLDGRDLALLSGYDKARNTAAFFKSEGKYSGNFNIREAKSTLWLNRDKRTELLLDYHRSDDKEAWITQFKENYPDEQTIMRGRVSLLDSIAAIDTIDKYAPHMRLRR
tara:strand:+ start:6975 stop:7451 length:477 start_codon:yes stop_codon:yes gene_type:complete